MTPTERGASDGGETSLRDLGPRYEELRRRVLGGEPQPGLGLAVLMHHGMAAWMDAWSRCTPQIAAVHSESVPLPGALRIEIVAVLAEMALGASRREATL